VIAKLLANAGSAGFLVTISTAVDSMVRTHRKTVAATMILQTNRAIAFVTLSILTLALPAGAAMAQMAPTDLVVRIDQLERQLRQLTGTIEQLQFRNQQLDEQVKRLSGEIDARAQDASRGTIRPSQQQLRPGAIPPPASAAAPPLTAAPMQPPAPAPSPGGRRPDVFDPTLNPDAPGAPRPLGVPGRRSDNVEPPFQTGAAPPSQRGGDSISTIIAGEEPSVGAPGGREPGAPLDLSTLATTASSDAPTAPRPPQAPRDPAAGSQLATLPPSQTPRDEYDLAYGYLLRKDYALAEDGLRTFLKKYPSDRMAADAQFWLGESMFQRQNYREAADAFVLMSKKYEHHSKAPDALLRLGQSLAALNERELSCATFGEIPRKYPRASLSVKQAAEREQKRVRC
jgi:tol-pal system protein YbgF